MTKANLTGPKGRLYAEPTPSTDENAFQVNNTSEQYYQSNCYKLHKSQVQPIPVRPNGILPYIKLTDFVPPDLIDTINKAKKIVFHAVGDTGAAKSSRLLTEAWLSRKHAFQNHRQPKRERPLRHDIVPVPQSTSSRVMKLGGCAKVCSAAFDDDRLGTRAGRKLSTK